MVARNCSDVSNYEPTVGSAAIPRGIFQWNDRLSALYSLLKRVRLKPTNCILRVRDTFRRKSVLILRDTRTIPRICMYSLGTYTWSYN